ncbi:ribosome recycling factor [bacterium]|nr:MAG: ribosome recycling factor [bacterium]RIK64446.1 MAG: ribosome recycling factor [Planctomycetota bacterium]
MGQTPDQITKAAEAAMQKVLNHLAEQFHGVSAGRASPAMVENIKFDYYGTPTPLKGAAQISTPDAGTIQIKPFDISQVKAISGAISAANIGMTPKDDGKIITLKLPMMTQETRQKLAKQVKDMAEQAKIPIKNARHEAMKHGDASLKESTITEDQHRKLKDDIQKLTDKYNKQIEDNLKKKTEEVMKA